MAPNFKDDLNARILAIEGAPIETLTDLKDLADTQNKKLEEMRNRLWQDQRENPASYPEFDQDKDKREMAQYLVAVARRLFGPGKANTDSSDTSWSVNLWDDRPTWTKYNKCELCEPRTPLKEAIKALPVFLRKGLEAMENPTPMTNCFGNARIAPFPPIGGG